MISKSKYPKEEELGKYCTQLQLDVCSQILVRAPVAAADGPLGE